MNNSQKIFSAVMVFGLLGLGACVSSQPSEPKEGNCITYPENRDGCKPDAPRDSKPDCFGGKDFICLKPSPKDISTDGGGEGW